MDNLEDYSDYDPYVFDEVSRTMARGGQAFLYDRRTPHSPDWPEDRSRGATVSCGDQWLFRLKRDGIDLFGFTCEASDFTGQDGLVLCSDYGGSLDDGAVLTEAQAQEIVGSTRVIFARAYDGEGWLVWRQFRLSDERAAD